MKWITRERPKIDRIACPWLIARLNDDHEMLKHGMVMFDALHAWCADAPLKKVARLSGSK
jgi:hypothetical protein